MGRLEYEQTYLAEIPYLEQNLSWKEGMKYRYSPESYPITQKQLKEMKTAGKLVGQMISERSEGSILEFRLDFVVGEKRGLYITEVQTDDRGLPAVAIAREVKGNLQPNIFPGVIPSLITSLKEKANKTNPILLVTYPESEEFYYRNFYDLAQIVWIYDQNVQVVVSPANKLQTEDNNNFTILENKSLKYAFRPDLIWDFTAKTKADKRTIQQIIDKSILVDIWSPDCSTAAKELRRYVPEIRTPQDPEVVENKNGWILKPISGRWSRGVVIGVKTDRSTWNQSTRVSSTIAQKYIDPLPDLLQTREGAESYSKSWLYSRVEGYYFKINGKWILADILVTATPDVPVHGKRDSIMIPALLVEDTEQ